LNRQDAKKVKEMTGIIFLFPHQSVSVFPWRPWRLGGS
jgi:hypothetical protein